MNEKIMNRQKKKKFKDELHLITIIIIIALSKRNILIFKIFFGSQTILHSHCRLCNPAFPIIILNHYHHMQIITIIALTKKKIFLKTED